MRLAKLFTTLSMIAVFLAFMAFDASAQRYRPNNNYYMQQQMQRQMQRQQQMQQQQRMRQQQEQMRRQQEMQRQAQQRQRQLMMQRQRQMQEQMRQRQMQAQRQRQQAIERQRRAQQERLKRSQQQTAAQNQRNIAKQQQALARQQAMRQQKVMKDRQLRLKKLTEQQRRKTLQEQTRQQQQSASLAALAASRAAAVSNSLRASPTAAKLGSNSTKAFQQNRQQQAQRQKVTNQLAKSQREVRANLKKLADTRQRIQQQRLTAARQAKQAQATKVQKAAQRNFRCSGTACGKTSGRGCSFHGDTLVKTSDGFQPIRDLEVGVDLVWAKHEQTGEEAWKPVVAHYSNQYGTTVHVTVAGSSGRTTQTIISNLVHPFFVLDDSSGEDAPKLISMLAPRLDLPVMPEGRWIETQNLRVGDRLLTTDNETAEVVALRTTKTPLRAFNLTVADFHTYFVKGSGAANDNSKAVWVHNDCFEDAKKLGYSKRIPPQKAPFDSKKQAVYYNSKNNTYITRDVTSHKGGHWKMFKKVGGVFQRIGTYNKSLDEKIGK